MSLPQPITTAPEAVHHGLLPPPFHCSSRRGGVRAAWVEASGELDLASAPELERALQEALASSQLVALDLDALTFIDSTGVHTIEDASVRALLQGRRLVVSRAPGHFRRILALTGTAGSIELLSGDQAAGLRLV